MGAAGSGELVPTGSAMGVIITEEDSLVPTSGRRD